jgi:hypothetical protein
MIIEIHGEGVTNLFELRKACCLLRCLFGPGKHRKQKSSKDRNDGNYNRDLDQGESSRSAVPLGRLTTPHSCKYWKKSMADIILDLWQ